jgi:hypothetical protein
MDGLAKTLWGQAVSPGFGNDELLELLHRLPIFGLLERKMSQVLQWQAEGGRSVGAVDW